MRRAIITLSFSLLPSLVWAEAVWEQGGGGPSVGDVATNITRSLVGVSGLLTAICYIVGIGFALSGLMKFKAHRDSPQQMPLSHPITDILIAIALIFLPTLSRVAGTTAFDTGANQVSPSGRVVPSGSVKPEQVRPYQPPRIPAPPPQQPAPEHPYQNR